MNVEWKCFCRASIRYINDFDGVKNKKNYETQRDEKSVAKSFIKS